MFTGIVTAIGRIRESNRHTGGLRLSVERLSGETGSGDMGFGECRSGDSVSVSGVCLTMLNPDVSGFSADVSAETLEATTLGDRQAGDGVNLELAVRAGDRLGGHLVSGHVDAAVRLLSREPDGDAERFAFELPPGLARYVSRKGSVCLDGVSLTVNAVSSDRFSVCMIPHTLSVTTLGLLAEGERVNLEVDMIARYLEKLVQEKLVQDPQP